MTEDGKSEQYPIVSIDHDADFASVKLGPGIEAKCYLKEGAVFSQDAKGRVIEIQILNLSHTTKPRPNRSGKTGQEKLARKNWPEKIGWQKESLILELPWGRCAGCGSVVPPATAHTEPSPHSGMPSFG
jgi:hypothetical protein